MNDRIESDDGPPLVPSGGDAHARDAAARSRDPAAAVLVRARRVAWLLDDSIPVPGTRFRFGIDPILGLGPGIGDAISWLVSLHLLWAGWRLRADPATLFRMAGNVLLDTILGSLPAVGDLFDFVFKANDRNLEILEALVGDPVQTRRSSVAWLSLIMGGSLAVMGATGWALFRVLSAIAGALGF